MFKFSTFHRRWLSFAAGRVIVIILAQCSSKVPALIDQLKSSFFLKKINQKSDWRLERQAYIFILGNTQWNYFFASPSSPSSSSSFCKVHLKREDKCGNLFHNTKKNCCFNLAWSTFAIQISLSDWLFHLRSTLSWLIKRISWHFCKCHHSHVSHIPFFLQRMSMRAFLVCKII